ncbi:hypothetical protein L2E82_37087 [Cichorium intybus]|uniref:Uncharacterized protein n=1 Tax=Cichorium intybus TaxID=13427 RepID=A0ACB9ACX6_CICIN|nr:hypothetical protein L2E82_37087 [Cichorium intybus]
MRSAIWTGSKEIFLGSFSIARRKILAEMGYEFTLMPDDIDEKSIRIEKPEELVMALAKAKADAVVSKLQTSDDQKKDVKPSILIASDTNCSSGLISINRRLDNRMNFARQDSKSQAKYMSLPSSQPPKFARTTVETDVPMKFIPYNNTHATKRVERKQSPRMDVAESGGKYILLIEFPGVSKDGIRSVQITKGRTVVCSLSDGTRSAYHKREILEGPFEAMWPLPFDVNSDSVSAEFFHDFASGSAKLKHRSFVRPDLHSTPPSGLRRRRQIDIRDIDLSIEPKLKHRSFILSEASILGTHQVAVAVMELILDEKLSEDEAVMGTLFLGYSLFDAVIKSCRVEHGRADSKGPAGNR